MQRPVKKEKWICVATVKAEVLLFGREFGRQGRGWWLNWQGRIDWCQPQEFRTVEAVAAAVRCRLALAGLELTALASCPPAREYQELWALVRRAGIKNKKSGARN